MVDQAPVVTCEQLHNLIQDEADPVTRATLQAEFNERCGGASTNSGGGGSGTNPPAPPKQPN